VRSLEFDASAFEDLAWWVETDRAQAVRVMRLIREVQRDPFVGIGKPEALKHDLKGCWSRRIQGGNLSAIVNPEMVRFFSQHFPK
jgi:toxin YoeB